MRSQLLALFLASLAGALPQDAAAPSDAAATAAAPAPSPSPAADAPPAGGDTATPAYSAPPEKPTGGLWNITHFVAPTRNNYWVNDMTNSARWVPVNIATNLILTNSNSTIMAQNKILAQNQAGGVSTWSGVLSGYAPSNNYLLVLTMAGNPDQKLAQSQGFWIKPNGTAAPQQIAGEAPAAAAAGPGAVGTPEGTTNGATTDTNGGIGAPDAGTAAPGVSGAGRTVASGLVVLAGFAVALLV